MKLYLIGDSISIHYGPFLKKYLGGLIEYSRKEGEEEALLNLDRPQGANGGDSSMVLDFLNAKKSAGGIPADVLLLNCGLHDIKSDPKTGAKQVPIELYKKNLAEILRVAAGMRLSTVWIRTTPCFEKIHNAGKNDFHRFYSDCVAYNSAADKIMETERIPSIDLFSFTLNLGDGIYCDHVHFHEHIRKKQAAFIAGWLLAYKENFCR